ncbi:MAG: hydantoinase B/oxoprolinase family protein, partial [Opitutaceae bacterium]
PGPACYGAGGPLTLTDVNLLLGRLDPALFGLPVFAEAAEARLEEVLSAIEAAAKSRPGRAEVLQGFLDIANERMADAIQRISVREGYDPAEYALLAFGGAGGLHACAVAERLGIEAVLFPADSGLLSAQGLRAAVPERFRQRQLLRPWNDVAAELPRVLEELGAEARAALAADGIDEHATRLRRMEVELRYAGQESGLALAAEPLDSLPDRFRAAYEQRFGYVPAGRALELVTVSVVASGVEEAASHETFAGDAADSDEPSERRTFHRAELAANVALPGNALIQDQFSTLFVAPGWRARIGTAGTVQLERVKPQDAPHTPKTTRDARSRIVELELFTCRFLALVDEMGVLLQRCALSVNVKERLDFSCALLDPDGELVANAPHIPVHLGALGECVRRVCATLSLQPGDVAITNHPGFGGSHLPDVTLIAPVHAADGALLGYVANRAHHAEIGGIRPGSMPPGATNLAEEGVVIAPCLLARDGRADWEAVRRVLASGLFPSRAVNENIADLHAQLASIRRGAEALKTLAAHAGNERVREFMALLKARSANALAEALARFGEFRR